MQSHRTRSIRQFATFLAVFSALASLAAAQTGATACNDMNRSQYAALGFFNSLNEPCATFTVGGITSPTECTMGYGHNSQNLFRCEGALPDVHCDAFGYSATVTSAVGGGCPSPPDFSGLKLGLDLFREIPEAVFKALTCIPPAKTTTSEPSAKITACAGSGDPPPPLTPLEGDVLQGANGALALWAPTSTAAATSGQQGTYNFFLSAFDLDQTGTPAEMNGVLGSIASAQVGLHGVDFDATVEIAHWSAGASQPESTYFEQIAGSITSDGRFDCTRVIDGTSQGDPAQIVHRTTYDGHLLRDHSAMGEAGNVYTIDENSDSWIVDVYAGSISHLYTWVYDPYVIPLFPGGIVFEEDMSTQGIALLSRSHPLENGGSFMGTEYEVVLRNGDSLPIRKTNLDVAQSVWEESFFSNFLELRPGDWRPATIVYNRYLDGTPAGRRITVTTRIVRATALAEEPAGGIPLPFDDLLNWQVWQ